MSIELIPTEDLVKELKNRFDTLIIGGIREKYFGEKNSQYYKYWSGSYEGCNLLTDIIKEDLIRTWNESREEDLDG